MARPKAKSPTTKKRKNCSSSPRSKRKGDVQKVSGAAPKPKSRRMDTDNGAGKDGSSSSLGERADSEKDDLINQLGKQVEELEEEKKKIELSFRHFYIARRGHNSNLCAWDQSNPSKWKDDITDIRFWTGNWVSRFALHATKYIRGLPDEDKKHIIESVKGYCVQEDFDYLAPRFPEFVRKRLGHLFLSMYIIKDILERFYTNPYWYLGPDPAAAIQDKEKQKQQEEFANTLHALNKKFDEARPTNDHAELWRVLTCRLGNVRYYNQGKNWDFGNQTKEYRQSRIPPMVSEILSSRMAQLLLPEKVDVETARERYKALLDIYERAAENAVHMSYWDPEFQICGLDSVDTVFHHESPKLKAAGDHCLLKGHKRLDGRRVLAVEVPGVLIRYKYWNREEWNPKISVLVEDLGRTPYPGDFCKDGKQVRTEEEVMEQLERTGSSVPPWMDDYVSEPDSDSD